MHRQVGDGIDFYNVSLVPAALARGNANANCNPYLLQVQYYNQGSDQYNTCDNLLFNSGNSFPESSVFETNTAAGVPLEKIVIGKPINSGAAANGYMDPSTLNDCVNQAKANGWNAGVMYWEFDSTAVGTILAVIG